MGTRPEEVRFAGTQACLTYGPPLSPETPLTPIALRLTCVVISA
jgi:hypothetical protein